MRVSNEPLLLEATRRIKVAMAYYNIERSQVTAITGQTDINYGAGLRGRSMRQTKLINDALKNLGVPTYWLLQIVDNEQFMTLEHIILGYNAQKDIIKNMAKERDTLATEYQKILEKYLKLEG
jgi:hypothetical protein